jgi:hypothetical protein
MENLPKPGVRQLQDRHSPQISGFGVRTVYHSRTQKYAKRYSDRFAKIRSEMKKAEIPPVASENTQSSLFTGHSLEKSRGSLVPQSNNANGGLFAGRQGG